MAVSLTAVQLRDEIGLPDTTVGNVTADRLLAVCSAEVQLYAPAAPEETQNEAVLRMAGHLDSSRDTSFLQEVKIADLDLTFRAAAGSALRQSGGMAILSPHKRRRAGVCEAVTT